MILEDLHMHTTFCDGKDAPEEMVRAALEIGLRRIGFSAHAYTDFDTRYCMQDEAGYRAEIARLKEKYKGKIEILCGVEQDYYSTTSIDGYDYVIGSVHYVKKGGVYWSVDESAAQWVHTVDAAFDGDGLAFAEAYFNTVKDVVRKINADIIGHFDLISKFNENNTLFDENDARYVRAWTQALDVLLAYQKPFEINIGAISRGYKTSAYPSLPMLQYIFENGGSVLLSSDAHSADTLCYMFDAWEEVAKEIGFNKLTW